MLLRSFHFIKWINNISIFFCQSSNFTILDTSTCSDHKLFNRLITTALFDQHTESTCICFVISKSVFCTFSSNSTASDFINLGNDHQQTGRDIANQNCNQIFDPVPTFAKEIKQTQGRILSSISDFLRVPRLQLLLSFSVRKFCSNPLRSFVGGPRFTIAPQED